jgi:hypothetical protein
MKKLLGLVQLEEAQLVASVLFETSIDRSILGPRNT